VTRRIADVDDEVAVFHRGVLRHDGDAALAFEVDVVHRALGHALVGAEGAGLVQQRVHQRGLAMIDVGDDGDVAAQRIGDGRDGRIGTRKAWVEHGHPPSIPEDP
jgi:hypothetical protein